MRKDIKGYEGIYAVTSGGRVWSYRRKKYLHQWTNNAGYKLVDLMVKNERKHYLVHRLVAEAFIPNPDNLPQVNHKDENKRNNKVSNLEWITHQDNINYGSHNERGACSRRKRVFCVELQRVFPSLTEAAQELGVKINCITIACQKGGKCGGYHWEYVEEE